MSDENFATFIEQERDRLNGEREAVLRQQQQLQENLVEINRELAAIGAYESTKNGKSQKPDRTQRTNGSSRSRRGGKREALMQVIRENNGLSRGEILERMGLKGDRLGEMSVSNALTALTKANTVSRQDGKYIAA